MSEYARNEYPRPQFRREKWRDLNGEWEFAFDDEKIGEKSGYATGRVALNRKIVVPFAYQSKASGIGEESAHEVVWYRRSFTLDTLTGNRFYLLNSAAWLCGRTRTGKIGATGKARRMRMRFIAE